MAMPTYQAPVGNVQFLLNDVLGFQSYAQLPGFADATPDVVEAILSEGGRVCEEVLQPLNVSGDREGCKRQADGSVTTPKGFREAYDAFAQGGWIGLASPVEYGGQGLPYTLAAAINEFVTSANMAFSLYPGLTRGAQAALVVHASDEQKALYMPKLVSGEWSGTMNLTEPHCGTDLGLIKTRATRNADGTFSITGQKIFISAGEHDLTSNIIHLVLARIEGAPAGTKGISMFIVPKFLPDAQGNPGARNAVSCGSIEHKMGIHGNSTCVMNYDGATGFLMGEENRGLNAMFVMMNEARLGVAVQGLSMSEVAYQNAVSYARERVQGRALTGAKEKDKAADPIIVHPDVRRMLLEMRAFNEAARGLILEAALQADVVARSNDEKAREEAEDMLGLLTPVLKGVLTDVGFDNTVKAQQIFGGHGYVGEWGMEQFVRDARIAMIYEGANGIQALDLVGRKLPKDNGRAVMAWFKKVGEAAQRAEGDATLAPLAKSLKGGLDHLQKATMWLMQNALAKPDNAGAASTDYMHLFGLVAMGHMWLAIAQAALRRKAEDPSTAGEMDAKLVTARFYMERVLPETGARLARLSAGADAIMALPAEAF
jgi:acyl-CoA dehydrogenase